MVNCWNLPLDVWGLIFSNILLLKTATCLSQCCKTTHFAFLQSAWYSVVLLEHKLGVAMSGVSVRVRRAMMNHHKSTWRYMKRRVMASSVEDMWRARMVKIIDETPDDFLMHHAHWNWEEVHDVRSQLHLLLKNVRLTSLCEQSTSDDAKIILWWTLETSKKKNEENWQMFSSDSHSGEHPFRFRASRPFSTPNSWVVSFFPAPLTVSFTLDDMCQTNEDNWQSFPMSDEEQHYSAAAEPRRPAFQLCQTAFHTSTWMQNVSSIRVETTFEARASKAAFKCRIKSLFQSLGGKNEQHSYSSLMLKHFKWFFVNCGRAYDQIRRISKGESC